MYFINLTQKSNYKKNYMHPYQSYFALPKPQIINPYNPKQFVYNHSKILANQSNTDYRSNQPTF